jgi:hypothetical protein
MPWDTTYWSERLKESKFDMKEEELRPYFALTQMQYHICIFVSSDDAHKEKVLKIMSPIASSNLTI